MSIYLLHEPAAKRRWWRYGIIIVLLVILVLGVGLFAQYKSEPQRPAPLAARTAAAETAVPQSISSKVLFAGDIYWGRSMTKWSEASPLKTAYPFSGLSGFHKENYDAWVGNLECPTVPGVIPTENEEKVQLKFNCSSEYLPEFAKWFDIVSLANNHSDNQGASGFAATRTQLDQNKIQYFGHYDPSVLDQVCEVVSLPVQVQLSNGRKQKGSLPFALCGYHGVFKVPSEQSLTVMQRYAKYMPVIAYPHMGTEYKPTADTLRTNLYRKMIDNGADAVLAGHPHWVQNSEAYKGKLIVYSMGNFIFDQQFESDVMRSAVMTLDLSLDKSIAQKQLEAWLKLGPTCQQFADSCLAEIETQQLSRLPLSFKWGILVTDNSNKLTKPASAELTQAVADRLNWNQTVTQLLPAGIPFTAR